AHRVRAGPVQGVRDRQTQRHHTARVRRPYPRPNHGVQHDGLLGSRTGSVALPRPTPTGNIRSGPSPSWYTRRETSTFVDIREWSTDMTRSDRERYFSHSESIHIDVTPQAVWDVVSDITRTGEWSPVCQAAWW